MGLEPTTCVIETFNFAMMIETLVIITGATGTGKTTLQKKLVDNFKLHRFITTTTREKRKHESNGVDYYFVDENFFLRSNNTYLFQSKVFGYWYGISRNEYTLAVASKIPVVLVATITNIQELKKMAQKIFIIKLDVRQMDVFLQKRKSVSDRICKRLSEVDSNEYHGIHEKTLLNIEVDDMTENQVFDQVVFWLRNQGVI